MVPQVVSRLGRLLSALLESEALTIWAGAFLVTMAWFTTGNMIAGAAIDALSPAVPLSTVPSIDCLMQYSRCAPA
jgi:hypothetical protein